MLAGAGFNHTGALILPNAATAFGIFFLRQFFRTLPIEYEESARVDGASRLTVLRRIVLPLSAPQLMAGNVISLLPMLAIFFLAQRYFVRSVAATGLADS